MNEHEILGIFLEQIGITHLVKHQKLAIKSYITFLKPCVNFEIFHLQRSKMVAHCERICA